MSASITKLADKLESAQNRLKRMKEKGEGVAVRGMRTVTIVAGGSAVGLIRALGNDKGGTAKVPGTQVDADLAMALVTTMAGLTEVAGKASDMVVDFGAGMLAVLAADAVRKATDDFQAKR